MTLAPGTKLGPYEIVAALGAGGMGEVYRARDTRLGRDVAVKVLPQHLSSSPEIRARFEREARTVSSLNHPNICTLFDVGREGETDYLVMELIEGETLAARLQRGPLPGPELLRLATQIADALDRAHRAGVVHRDLKPGNVMLTRSGAKLMDFGLSRVTGMAGPDSGSGRTLAALTQSPTVAQALTAEGTLLGTFQYMSPEQLEGKEADARSDIWAYGCVLYEMATGRRAFAGRSQASLIAAILEREPAAIGEAPSGSVSVGAGAPPPGLERLVRNCLAKDPDERIQTAHDVRLHLQAIAEGAGYSSTSVISSPGTPAPLVRPRAGAARLPWALAIAGFVVAAGAIGWLLPRAFAPPPPFRFRLDPIPGAMEMYWPRISPDGRQVLLQVADSAGVVRRAWVRPLDQIDARPIPGTEGLQRAYWSPDGKEITFVANGSIQRLPIAGGSPTVVCAAPNGADLSWSTKGVILMDGQLTDSLRSVPAGGGELRPATRIDHAAGETGSAWPHFLPDGEHFLFIGIHGAASGGTIRLGTIGSLDSKPLGHSDGRVEYGPGGWVLFLRGTTLLAQKLDLGAAKLTGQPITIAEHILLGSSSGHFSISRTGVLAFAREGATEGVQLQTADRTGAIHLAPLASGPMWNPTVSPDGHRVLYLRLDPGNNATGEVHLLDPARSTDTRLTFTSGVAVDPAWSPDGLKFAYVARAAGKSVVHVGSTDGIGAQDSIPLRGELSGGLLFQWAAAGQRLVANSGRGAVYGLPTEGGLKPPVSLLDSTQVLMQAQISPDGRWLAGTAGQSPNPEVYVVSLAGPPGRWQISNTTGYGPRWTRGGRELVYETWDSHIAVVDIDTKDGFHPGTPQVLFPLPVQSNDIDQASWDVDASGEHFYLLTRPRAASEGLIEVASGFGSLVNRK